ncbi:hypothetical protein GCM10027043_03450 [Ferruginibacter profundus]
MDFSGFEFTLAKTVLSSAGSSTLIDKQCGTAVFSFTEERLVAVRWAKVSVEIAAKRKKHMAKVESLLILFQLSGGYKIQSQIKMNC